MAGLNVPASRNGLPVQAIRGRAPSGHIWPTTYAPRKPKQGGYTRTMIREIAGTETAPPAVLLINTGRVSPVRGPISGVSEIRSIRVAGRPGAPAGPQPTVAPAAAPGAQAVATPVTRAGAPRSGGATRSSTRVALE